MRALLEVTTVRLHCGACGNAVIVTGPQVRDESRAWAECHYLPVVDSMDLTDPNDGAYVCTWQRAAA